MLRMEKGRKKCVVHIDGEMTIYSAAALKEELVPMLEETREMEFDLGAVTEIDSAGVQLLMLAKKERMRHGRRLTLVQHSKAVLDVFDLMGLVPHFSDPVVLTRSRGDHDGA